MLHSLFSLFYRCSISLPGLQYYRLSRIEPYWDNTGVVYHTEATTQSVLGRQSHITYIAMSPSCCYNTWYRYLFAPLYQILHKNTESFSWHHLQQRMVKFLLDLALAYLKRLLRC